MSLLHIGGRLYESAQCLSFWGFDWQGELVGSFALLLAMGEGNECGRKVIWKERLLRVRLRSNDLEAFRSINQTIRQELGKIISFEDVETKWQWRSGKLPQIGQRESISKPYLRKVLHSLVRVFSSSLRHLCVTLFISVVI